MSDTNGSFRWHALEPPVDVSSLLEAFKAGGEIHVVDPAKLAELHVVHRAKVDAKGILRRYWTRIWDKALLLATTAEVVYSWGC